MQVSMVSISQPALQKHTATTPLPTQSPLPLQLSALQGGPSVSAVKKKKNIYIYIFII